jgi:hypothetical protein
VLPRRPDRGAGAPRRGDGPLSETNRPIPGREYIHAKSGNRYTVLHIGIYCGRHDECGVDPAYGALAEASGFPEGTELVVYVGHYDSVGKPGRNRIYIRPLDEWFELVEIMIVDEPGLKGSRIAPRFHLAEAAS